MELAQLAGVSQKTVNRALSGHIDVNAKTRQRIQQLAESHGYLLNQAASAIRSGRYGNIGMLVSENVFFSYTPAELIGNLKKFLDPHHLLLILACLSDGEFTDDALMKNILQKIMCDGLLVNYTCNFPEYLLKLLKTYRLPAVWINAKLSDDCVFHDEYAAGITLTRYLIERGHRRITYINTCGISHHCWTDRRDGYIQAMKESGLVPDFHESHPVNNTVRHELISHVLNSPQRPTAIIACSPDFDISAAIALGMGLKIPEDLSLATFYIKPHFLLNMQTTIMMQQEELLCRHAVEMLLRKIDNPEIIAAPEKIPLTLCEGNSTAFRAQ